jgi:serine/threonine protein kinase/WD40 repeat protein/Tfp pilus assembly protein PilF
LEQLLADPEQLSAADYQALERHTEACPTCRNQLEHLLHDAETEKWQKLLGASPSPTTPEVNGPGLPPHPEGKAEPGPFLFPPSTLAGYLGQLEHYHIVKRLGSGAMGAVFLAYDARMRRQVALKVPRPDLGESTLFRNRFAREAHAAAAVKHEHVVTTYHVANTPSFALPYLVMEYIDGETLGERLQQRKVLPPKEAVEIAVQVASGLAAAHAQAVVHRDIKPSNIMLEKGSGRAKLTDFGLARALDGTDRISSSGAMVGTPSYMSPEQIESPHRVDARSDVFGLGVVLYEMLTGERPFRGTTHAVVLQQIVYEEPIAPRKLSKAVGPDLDTITLKCLAKEPTRRYQTAKELGDDLRRWRNGEPIQARRVSRLERSWRWCRRNRTVSILSSSVVVLLVALMIGSWVASLLREQRDRSRAAEEKTLELLQRAQNAERENQIRSLLAEARSLRQSGQAGQRHKALDKLAEAAKLNPSSELLLELRNEAIACLARTDVRLERRLKAKVIDYDTWSIAFDARFQCYALGDKRGTIVIRRVADDEEIARLPAPVSGIASGLRFSPDADFLFASYEAPRGHFQLWDLRQDKPALVKLQEPINHAFDFRRASGMFAAGRTDGSIGLYDCASGRRIKLLSQLGLSVRNLTFSPDGRQITVWNRKADTPVQVFDLEQDKVIATVPHPEWTGWTGGVAWRGDGRLLALACDDQRIYVWDVVKQRLQAVLEGHANVGIGFAFSQGGDLLVSTAWDGTTLLWDAVRGQQLLSISPAGFEALRSDDRQLAIRNGEQLELWELIGGECRVLHPGLVGNRTARPYHWGPSCVDYSPDGRLLVSAGSNGVQLWDPATATELAQLSAAFWDTALFHPSGTSLFTGNDREGHWLRWPIQLDQAHGRLQVGPPQRLDLPCSPENTRLWREKKGLSFTVLDRANHQAFVINADKPAEKLVLGPHRNINCIALSPDGDWVVTGASRDSSIKVWDAIHGRSVKELHCDFSELAFSADSHWMITRKGSDHRLWRVGSWEPGRAFRSVQWAGINALAFAMNDALMAVTGVDSRYLELIHPKTGQKLATLEAPDLKPYTTLRFSPDGSQLAAATSDHMIHLWDLRAIRRQLAVIGLDWHPASVPPSTDRSTVQPIQVKVEPGDPASLQSQPRANSNKLHAQLLLYSLQIGLTPYHPEPYRRRGNVHYYLGEFQKAIDDFTEALRWQSLDSKRQAYLYEARAANYLRLKLHAQAVADLQKAVELNADNPSACNTLAWLYVVGPEELREPNKALSLAQKAVKLKPAEEAYFNTLGVVHYQLGQYPPAVVWLERSLRKSRHSPAAAYDLFFLAMCHARLGDADQARDCYHQALQCVQEKQGQLSPNEREELNAFRAEADAVLAKGPRP